MKQCYKSGRHIYDAPKDIDEVIGDGFEFLRDLNVKIALDYSFPELVLDAIMNSVVMSDLE
ncbi:MAG: hypothetical protein II670_07310 [Alphaproteobacteria bacterium]|nr:hypothetical protein [Alphaproteobacteria bacterium]